VLTLVTFDIQGVYNRVNKEVLQQRLQKTEIPEFLIKWIYSFCSNWRAAVSFADFCSAMEDIQQRSLL
jgi:hypothetical protein